MTHCFSGDDDADADDDKLGQAIDLTSTEVPQVITSPEVPQVKTRVTWIFIPRSLVFTCGTSGDVRSIARPSLCH